MGIMMAYLYCSTVTVLRPSCCSLVFGNIDFLVLFFFPFFWKCWLEIWLSLYLPLHHRTSSQVNKTPHSFTVFSADIFSSSSCRRSPLTVSQSESLYVVFGRSLFSTTICLLLLSVSLSLLLPRSLLSFPAKATHRRSLFFFFLSL